MRRHCRRAIEARRHQHLTATSIDLPTVEPIGKKTIQAAGLADRVKTASLDFFAQPLPKADVVTMVIVDHSF